MACGGFFQDACEKNIISPSSLLWFNQRHIIIYVQGSLVFNSSFLAEQHFKVWKKNRIDSPSLQFTPLNPHVGWFKWVCLKGYNLQFQRRIPSRFPISGGFPISQTFSQSKMRIRWISENLHDTDLKPMVLDMFWPSTAVRDLGSWRGFTLSRLGWKPNLQGIMWMLIWYSRYSQ